MYFYEISCHLSITYGECIVLASTDGLLRLVFQLGICIWSPPDAEYLQNNFEWTFISKLSCIR